jgi:hypothetical protein
MIVALSTFQVKERLTSASAADQKSRTIILHEKQDISPHCLSLSGIYCAVLSFFDMALP